MTVSVLAILAAVPATAQDVFYRFEQRGVAPAPDDQIFTVPVPPPPGGGMIEHGIGLLAVEPFAAAKPITGAPYSAEIATDVVQQLADGNRIERHTTTAVARDGRGRVRREQQLTAIGPILPQGTGRIITIMDPVARVSYSLDPARRVAMRSPLPEMNRLQTVIKSGDGVARVGIAAGVASAGIPAGGAAGIGARSEIIAIKEAGNNVRTESLGTAQIEGVDAQGTRSVVTIEAGAIGNQGPIEIVSEQWYSPEIGEVVLSRRSDPRFGETTYRLRNIVRAEPSADLFEVPADYTVESLPAFGQQFFTAPRASRPPESSPSPR
jgi:hypothetical protein